MYRHNVDYPGTLGPRNLMPPGGPCYSLCIMPVWQQTWPRNHTKLCQSPPPKPDATTERATTHNIFDKQIADCPTRETLYTAMAVSMDAQRRCGGLWAGYRHNILKVVPCLQINVKLMGHMSVPQSRSAFVAPRNSLTHTHTHTPIPLQRSRHLEATFIIPVDSSGFTLLK